jgi:hypothetical protein
VVHCASHFEVQYGMHTDAFVNAMEKIWDVQYRQVWGETQCLRKFRHPTAGKQGLKRSGVDPATVPQPRLPSPGPHCNLILQIGGGGGGGWRLAFQG